MMKVLRSFPPTWDWPMASESRRELILEAMIRVVGSKGYKETSVADVIEEAGTSRGPGAASAARLLGLVYPLHFGGRPPGERGTH